MKSVTVLYCVFTKVAATLYAALLFFDRGQREALIVYAVCSLARGSCQ